MIILGLNAYHGDSAACLIKDGCLVAAAEEERFRRIKHWAGLPTRAIDYCLREGGVSLGDVEHIAINRKPGVNNWRRLRFVLSPRPDPRLIWQKIQNMRSASSAGGAIEQAYSTKLKAEVHHVEHHLAHLASAYSLSGFTGAVCLSVDGFGDFASTAMGWRSGNQITIDQRVYFPHSLGIFYSAITQFIGFPHYGDEYKVMGLAPYGAPIFLEQMRQLLHLQRDGSFKLDLAYFRHHTDNVSYSWNDCAPEVGILYTEKLTQLLGPARQPNEPLEQRHKDLARSAQAIYEEAFFALLEALHARHPSPNLALSGGCAMNSVANGKVYLRTPFRKMYLPAAAGDAGGAIGAATIVAAKLKVEIKKIVGLPDEHLKGERPKSKAETKAADRNDNVGWGRPPNEQRPNSSSPNEQRVVSEDALSTFQLPPSTFPPEPSAATFRPSTLAFSLPTLSSPYLGPHFSADEIWEILESGKDESRKEGCNLAEIRDETALCQRTAQAIAEGKVVGWFQGRMEWGPRALGSRSILCDPRRADMKEILNAKIKSRESFRPFAPSILREAVAEWFEQEDDVPYMMEVFQIRAEKRALLPAVCHVDGSGRLQTVHREINPLFHLLISTFYFHTGVPLVLNTSFNENEPVVCRPEEALACFLRTNMDVLVIGSFFLERKKPGVKSSEQRVGSEEPAGGGVDDAPAIPPEVHAIAKRLGEGLNAEQVYLFGSYARGHAGPDSDLDLMVVVPDSRKSRYARAVEARGYLREISFPADVIVMTRAEWERDLEAVCSLASTVKREGRLLNGREKT